MGLIDIARKSGNKLTYHFKTINEDKAFFLLTTEVFAHEHNLHASPAENLEENTEELAHENIVQEGVFSIESISELHDLLNKNNIKIIFNNYFNTDSLETLLIFLDKQICETLNVDRKVYTVMVELFLNIIIHGSNPIESKRYKGNPGLFFISEVDGKFIINTSSYITNDKIDVLLEKVDYVNNMTTEETEAMEESIDVQKVVAEKGGLGLASIRQITKSNIEVHLCKVDDEYTFLTISCSLSKAPKVPFEEIVLQLDESQWADSEVADVITEEGLELLSDEMLVVDALNAEFHLGNDSDGHQPVPEAGKKEENPAEDLSANKHIEAAQKLSGAKETEEENNQSEL